LVAAPVFQSAWGFMAANFTDIMQPPKAVEGVLTDQVVTLSIRSVCVNQKLVSAKLVEL